MWSRGAGVFNPSCSLLWCKARLLIKPIRSGKKNSPTAVLWSTGSGSAEWGPRTQTSPQMGGWQEMINDYWSEANNSVCWLISIINLVRHKEAREASSSSSPTQAEVISATQKRRRLSSAAERRQGLRVVTDTKRSDNSTEFFWCQRAPVPSRAEASGGRKKGGREREEGESLKCSMKIGFTDSQPRKSYI